MSRASVGPVGRAWFTETRYELLRLLRTPAYSVPTMLLPLFLFAGLGLGSQHGDHRAAVMAHMLVSLSTFGMIAASLFGVGAAVASEREQGVLELKRALPLPSGAYFGAKALSAMAVSALSTLALMLLAALAGGLRLAAWQWPALLALNVAGTLPFCAIGLYVGSRVGASAAPGVINLVYLPMSFLSGLWMPLSMLPHSLQGLAPIWPAYHYVQLPLAVLGDDDGGAALVHGLVLAVLTVLFARAALRRLLGAGNGGPPAWRRLHSTLGAGVAVIMMLGLAQPHWSTGARPQTPPMSSEGHSEAEADKPLQLAKHPRVAQHRQLWVDGPMLRMPT